MQREVNTGKPSIQCMPLPVYQCTSSGKWLFTSGYSFPKKAIWKRWICN